MFLWPVLLLLWTKVIFYEITEIATNKLQKTNKKGSKTKKNPKKPGILSLQYKRNFRIRLRKHIK